MLALLSEALQSVGSEIEHLVLLPPSSSLSDPKEIVRDEIAVLLSKQSRVFIVLKASLPLATHLFKEAKKIGLMGQESAWIVSDVVSSLLDSVNTSLISSMEGALGIKTYYSEETTAFLHFKAQFREIFRLEYMQEDNLEPGIHALRVYDSITAISQTLKELGSDRTNLSKNLLEGISSSNFGGLSGDIRFLDGKLSETPIYRIVNIGGKRYRELEFWSSKFGFSGNLNFEQSGKNRLSPSLIIWPGDLVARVPKGWTMPIAMKKMRIGVPDVSFFDQFVKVELNDPSKKPFDGFCIEVFEEVVKILKQNYSFPYDFISFDGAYGELIDSVINKSFDAVVGDITILANRSLYVEFTQPFAESGLSMLVPVKPLEGSARNCNVVHLFFSFYAHGEKIQSKYTEVVVVAWLFVVMVLTSSYTASLSSMLTVRKLEPKMKDIEWIRRTNATVACDGDTFVLDYLQRVLRLNNIKSVVNPHDYPKEFDSGSITAAFLELPYEKVLRQEYCNRYTTTGPTYRFGGFGFVFQKGSPIAADVSEAILILSEDGRLKEIEKKWLSPSKNCSSDTTTGTDSLSLKSFWGLYLISGRSTILMPSMPFQLNSFSTAAKRFPFLLISFLLILYHAPNLAADARTINIGAILDVGSRAGKEQKAALTVAVKNFNSNSEEHKLAIHFANSIGEPLQATYAAKHLVEEKQVKLITGMQTWQEATLVADVGKQAQVPVLSFAAAAITLPLTQLRWPSLLQMATNSSAEMNCIAAVVQSFNWRRVIAIYEDDMSGSESGMLALLSEALQSVGCEIEHLVLLPPSSSLSDPKEFVRDEIAVLLSKQSRVFIVLKSSPLATHLFKEAKKFGLMGQESAWIVSDAVSGLLDSVHTSLISSMEGALGIKTYYSEETMAFLHFKAQFREIFRLEYMQEDNLEPGIHALRAYDSITAISKTLKALGSDSTDLSKNLLEGISSSNFGGLSGDIRFLDGKLSESPVYRIVNIGRKRYRELAFWSSKFGFSGNLNSEQSGKNRLSPSLIIWPGDLKARVPKGWAMPTVMKKMRIGVPNGSFSDKLVKVESTDSGKKPYDGFCIEVFEEVVKILERNYSFPYDFISFGGTYGELIDKVINESFDAVVGDVTILANRSLYVEFTQPFAESGLSMLVPVSEAHKAWLFFKPLSLEMWVVTCALLSCTMLAVWFFEHQTKNPEFDGPWKDQLATAMWFIFSSLFYAHREKIQSKYTKVVLVAWLFVVLVLTSSYTASLSSMLTVRKLEPKVKDIEWIRRTNATVACDGDTFVLDYLQRVLRLNNIKSVINPHDYPKEFDSGSITAAFLELPYEKVFRQKYCNRYTTTGPTYRFGGFGFVFQKGSPIAADVSEAILIMSEDGRLKEIEKKWLSPSKNCSSDTTTGTDSLSLKSFWGLYLISCVPSTLCFLVFLVRLPKRTSKVTSRGPSFGRKTVELVRNLSNVGNRSLGRVAPDINERGSAQWELISPSELGPEALEALRPNSEGLINSHSLKALTAAKRFPFLLISFLLILYFAPNLAADARTINIGAILDVGSRAGKEQKAALTVAVKNFNSNSEEHKLAIHFANSIGEPLQATYAAKHLVEEKQVKLITGMQTWQEATLVADVGKQAQVPVLSFAAAAITPPLTQLRWPYLLQMATNSSAEMNCIAAIVQSFNWRRVIVIYEYDMSGSESGILALLSQALQSVGSEIEHLVLLPPSSSLSDPKEIVRDEIAMLLSKQSRVFIVLKASLPLATHLFKEAKKIGLMGQESAWIVSDAVSGLLDSVHTSLISSLEGALGIKTYYSEETTAFLHFKAQFREIFRLEYMQEDNLEPGIHALRAYDSITAISKTLKALGTDSTDLSKNLLEGISSSNFGGLSGDIRFLDGKLSESPVYRIVNIGGKRYRELAFWSSKFGFSGNLNSDQSGKNRLSPSLIIWPGDLEARVPKGWAMPTVMKKMRIGVPNGSFSDKLVKVESTDSSKKRYDGFCIEVFEEVVKILERNYSFPYDFFSFGGTYGELIDSVTNKSFDAVVGDVTILANRSLYVEFTQPFAESGLSMLVPVSEAHKAWMFFKPLSLEMWVVTCALLSCTMLAVWFFEHQTKNPEFEGPWKDQLATSMWFIFSSLFYAHREKIQSNYTKVVVVAWFFVVMVLTSSYTASLSSMLTVQKLEPKLKDIDWLRRTNATVACDGRTFVPDYLKRVLRLNNIKSVVNPHDYPKEFDSGNITAAFLELPYEKVFRQEYCNRYTTTGPTYRFGGFGFVFQKGSPIAADVSEAILILSEDGTLKRMEKKWLSPSKNCSSDTTTGTDSLSLKSFWGLYTIAAVTCAACFLVFQRKKYISRKELQSTMI
ncbi:hypothetical protein RJ640_017409 [Escallonia rubra]|uniref:Ionotropic glutamate receptor C-terminal domain-containing protein n=1 Tax=Escallonia rubra TaxID=112253 RepID=A0AA88UC80_9ASTE|nr:hypothetical protein RJ640_017409 [Escallonia rubra]